MGNTVSLSIESLVRSYRSGTSAYRLAKNNGCSVWSVITRLRKAGVEMRPDGVPKSLIMTVDQGKTFDSLNTGLLLGDASINGNQTDRTEKCFLRMEQSDRRRGWLDQVQATYVGLGVYVNVIPVKPKSKVAEIDGRRITSGPSSLLYTGVSDEFRELRRKWYPKDGMKRVPTDVKLDALSVAMWLCGDGSSNGVAAGQIIFYTNGFLKKDVELLSRNLEMDLGVENNIRRHVRQNEWVIATGGRDATVLLRDLVFPYVPECCLYKFKHVRRSIPSNGGQSRQA